MKTYYVGNPEDITNSSLAVMVEMDASQNINLNNLQDYIDNTEIGKLFLTRNDDGQFFKSDISDITYKFRYIIYQNSNNECIGYTDMEDILDFGKYNIHNIGLLFNFTIINKEVVVSTTINYNAHESDTFNHKAHLTILDLIAPRKETFDDTQNKDIVYSRNLYDLSRSALKSRSKLFRYSNQFIRTQEVEDGWGYTGFEAYTLSDPKGYQDLIDFVPATRFPEDYEDEFHNPIMGCMSYIHNGSVQVYFVSDVDHYSIDLNSIVPGHHLRLLIYNGIPMISKDFIIAFDSSGYYLIYGINGWRAQGYSKVSKDIKFFKDNITKTLYAYSKINNQLNIYDPFVSNNIRELRTNFTNTDILYYSLGSLITVDINEGSQGKYFNAYHFNIANHTQYDIYNTIELSKLIGKSVNLALSRLLQINARSYILAFDNINQRSVPTATDNLGEYYYSILKEDAVLIEFTDIQDAPILTYLGCQNDFRNLYKIKHNNHIDKYKDSDLPILFSSIYGNMFIEHVSNNRLNYLVL